MMLCEIMQRRDLRALMSMRASCLTVRFQMPDFDVVPKRGCQQRHFHWGQQPSLLDVRRMDLNKNDCWTQLREAL